MIEQYTAVTNQTLKENTEKLDIGLSKVEHVVGMTLDHAAKLDILKIETKNMDTQITKIAERSTELESKKMDASTFDHY